jgi:hypothetical protein
MRQEFHISGSTVCPVPVITIECTRWRQRRINNFAILVNIIEIADGDIGREARLQTED